MNHWYIIIIVCLGVCVPQIPHAGSKPAKPLNGLNGPLIKNVESTRHAGKYFAQNDPKKRSSTVTADDLSKAGEKTPPSETPTKDKDAPINTTPMKPFVPSETIPADQGVDFPYDI
jgi:hypothetical protein